MTLNAVPGDLEGFFADRFDGPLSAMADSIATVSEAITPARGSAPDGVTQNFARVADAHGALVSALSTLQTQPPVWTDEDSASRLRHDLRSKLSLIVGYSELVEEDLDPLPDERCAEALSRIRMSAHDLVISVDALVELGAGRKRGSAPHRAHTLELAGAALSDGLTGCILLVDDSDHNRDLLAHYLTPQGHTIVHASTGEAAFERLAEQSVDLILLDMIMPGISGMEVLEQLKSAAEYWSIPVVVISGLSDINAVAPCIAAGADDFMTKPFNPVLLRARIESCLQKKRYADREKEHLRRLEEERAKTEQILSAILPAGIIGRLRAGEHPIADRREEATVLFADIVGFTELAARTTPSGLVTRLDALFSGFDERAAKHGVEKIKTIGDAYMASCGASQPVDDHADRCAAFAIDVLDWTAAVSEPDFPLSLRIGLHSGPVVAGLIGRNRYAFDVWGETVNRASRIESHGRPNAIMLSEATVAALKGEWSIEACELVAMKGLGTVQSFRLFGAAESRASPAD